ncbi:PhzF family phenazine biosynthesis protein [Providencia rustigianii]|uniref:Phenazine biosynthesis protein, PhzF family n=1 Tax=Providencia rustigianii DSM 4541 TaxID=500637 RepID=D1NZU7_9GAMM|nr:PhzF family phenazine biosynthesis protein [Providencia rustigianii]EFB73363.1 phenazine biosynthesis protein, PhzF family [Providencia rustigianii DSM 4541]
MKTLSIPIYYVDAFTDRLFHGNPAAVVLLDEWLPDERLIAIAAEINLPETAFLVDEHIRWFTPVVEVKLCGHATLAAAFILNKFKGHPTNPIIFQSLSGELTVHKHQDSFTLDFPILESQRVDLVDYPQLSTILNTPISELWIAKDRYLCFVDSPEQVQDCQPNMAQLAQLPLPGLTITAKNHDDQADFVSRYFAPAKGVNEDPVTGTSHCAIAPIWAKRLQKNALIGHQISARGGKIDCLVDQSRVKLTGKATLFLAGTIHV